MVEKEDLWDVRINKIDTIEEAEEVLTFFATFAVGCGKLGLEELANTWKKRFNDLYVHLMRVGHQHHRHYTRGWTDSTTLNNLITSIGYHLN